MTWISDDVIVTGSRDSTMAAWKVPDLTTLLVEERLSLSSLMNPWPIGHPLAESVPSIDMLFHFSNHVTQRAVSGNKVRSLVCNRRMHTLASLQTNICDCSVHFWDTQTFRELGFINLFHRYENVCLEIQPERNLYAVGSRSHVSLIDWRTNNSTVGSIRSKDQDNGEKINLVEFGTRKTGITFYRNVG
uniref:DDB1- and CUL4-associated factor 12 beta-propeller domain-containing protein n=1 Tax=Amphimedon queenslandica TaxID=400682 RepID=A0A1X7SL62_AMPQE